MIGAKYLKMFLEYKGIDNKIKMLTESIDISELRLILHLNDLSYIEFEMWYNKYSDSQKDEFVELHSFYAKKDELKKRATDNIEYYKNLGNDKMVESWEYLRDKV